MDAEKRAVTGLSERSQDGGSEGWANQDASILVRSLPKQVSVMRGRSFIEINF